MLIKYEYCGDNTIINVPDSAYWKICFRLINDSTPGDDYGLYLITDEKEILLRDTDCWCSGRPELPYTAVGAMYEEIVDIIASKIEAEPNLRIVDVNAIEGKLLSEKYEKKWLENGYVKLREDGSW